MPTPGYVTSSTALPDKWADMLDLLATLPQYASSLDLLRLHNVMDNITHNQLVAQRPRPKGFVLKNMNTCSDGTTNLYSDQVVTKRWAPVEARGRKDYCYTEFQADQWFGQFRPTADNIADLLTVPEFRQFFDVMATMDVLKDVWMQAWFASTSNTAAGSGSGSQTVTSADMVPYLNQNSGFWEQLAAGVGTGPTDTYRYTIAANGEATKALQLSTFTDALAWEALLKVRTKAGAILQSQSNKVIMMTQSVYNGIQGYAMDRQMLSGFHRVDFGGIERDAINGVPIIPIPAWDDIIFTAFDNGTKWDRPHRIVMTTVDNLGVGFEDANVIFPNSKYDDRIEKVYTKFGGRMDYLLLDAASAAVAY